MAKEKKPVAVPTVIIKSTNHPAAFHKIVCPKCKLGHAVKDFNQHTRYICDRCGMAFTVGKM